MERKGQAGVGFKDDARDMRLEIKKVRAESQQTRYDLLKWRLAGRVAIAAIMDRGFGWPGL